MTKLNEQLPLDAKGLREALNSNFHLLNILLNLLDSDEIITLVRNLVETNNQAIQAQIQAIIDPRYNEVALELKEARKDSHGIIHTTLDKRILAEINYLQKG